MKYNNWLLAAILAIVFVACGPKENTTESGIEYTFVKEGSGKTPEVGDYWAFNLEYLDNKGELLFSSRDQRGGPIETNFVQYPNNSSIEECFNYLSDGDSAIFMVPADSFYTYTVGRMTPAELAGTKIEVRIGVESVYTREEFFAMDEERNKARVEQEVVLIEEYISENGIEAEITEEGVYYQITEPGTGEKPQAGEMVKVNYKGYLLDGTVFDTSIPEEAQAAGVYNPGRPYEPYQFAIQTGNAITGWHIGIAQLNEGAKAKLILPSRFGYGPRGSGQIKPNSVLVFDVELVEIVENEGN